MNDYEENSRNRSDGRVLRFNREPSGSPGLFHGEGHLLRFGGITQSTNGGTTLVRITNKDILAALNASGTFNFAPNASLLLRSVDAALPYFEVRETNGGLTNTTVVTNYLTLTTPDDAVHGCDGKLTWAIWDFSLDNQAGTDFELWGLTTLYPGLIPTGGGYLQRTVRLTSNVSGPGHLNGATTQLLGTISARDGRVD